MASELYNVIDALSREKGIDPQIVVSAVEDAIVVATRKYYKTQENLRAELDKESGQIRAYAVRSIVRKGNSGGPLLAANGKVLGVVFATAVDSPDTGFVLTDREILPDLVQARSATRGVGTEGCVAD